MNDDPSARGQAIAIIGLAGRFPGADDVSAFWENTSRGNDVVLRGDVLEPPTAEQRKTGFPRDYIRARGLLDDIATFDAKFFDFTPSEASHLDPQQRIWLELAYHALEQGGYAHGRHEQIIGVWGGSFLSTYLYSNLIRDRASLEEFMRLRRASSFALLVQNDPAFMPTRVAYKLDLRGPAINVQTGCSTSLVAVAAAVQSLASFEVDMALAGGVCVTIPERNGYFYQEGAIYSRDGHCRPYDADACGTVFGNGAGVALLKRLADAERDHDPIFAVIRGAATNNDGHTKVSYLAPSVKGQAEVIALALSLAQVSADTIGYVEGHGTATPMGDPIEVEALTRAFRESTNRRTYCCLGSAKGDIGHLDTAAGIAGLTRATMALYHRTLPATAHFSSPNPQLGLGESPFFVLGERTEWAASDHPRRAGVSSFGIGGTNAHLVLEEYVQESISCDPTQEDPQVLLLSAKSVSSLDRYTAELGTWSERQIEGGRSSCLLSDVAATLRDRRQHFNERRAVRAVSMSDAMHALRDASRWVSGTAVDGTPQLAFAYPGQGSLLPSRLVALLQTDHVFRAELQRFAGLASELLAFDLMGWYRATDPQVDEVLNDNAKAQLAVLCTSLALTEALEARGIVPKVVVGHSLGEWAAAHAAKIVSAEDALRAVYHRGRLMQDTPSGGAIIVRASAETLRPHLPAEVSLACINADGLCLLSGASGDLTAFAGVLDRLSIGHQSTTIRVAVHSGLMDACIAPLQTELEKITFHPPVVPMASCVTGQWLTDAEAQDCGYWARQLRACVDFRAATSLLLQKSPLVTVEVGMGTALTSLIRSRIKDSKRCQGIALLPAIHDARVPDGDRLEQLPLELWVRGCDIALVAAERLVRSAPLLPSYQFDRDRYWVDGPLEQAKKQTEIAPVSPREATNPPHSSSLECRLKGLLADVSGIEAERLVSDATFSSQGIESLVLVQFAERINDVLGTSVGYSRLVEFNTLDLLAATLTDLPSSEQMASERPLSSSRRTVPTIMSNMQNQRTSGKFSGLVRFRKGDGDLPLLVVHGDQALDGFVRSLPMTQGVYAYGHQGSDGERMCHVTVESLAERCAEEWTAAVGASPCVLVGHSYGGMIAYHVAKLLSERGQSVRLLAMIDTMHPRVFRNDNPMGLKWLHWEYGRKRQFIKEYKAYVKALLFLQTTGRIPPERRSGYILYKYGVAIARYKPQPLDVDMLLFQASVNTCRLAHNGWRAELVGSMTVDVIDGNHLTIIRDPKRSELIVQRVARELERLKTERLHSLSR